MCKRELREKRQSEREVNIKMEKNSCNYTNPPRNISSRNMVDYIPVEI